MTFDKLFFALSLMIRTMRTKFDEMIKKINFTFDPKEICEIDNLKWARNVISTSSQSLTT